MRIAADPALTQLHGNPYQWMLYTELTALGVQVEDFTRAALDARVDLVHVHWPEACVTPETTTAALRRMTQTLGKLAVARARKIPVVWTIHNLASHERRHPLLERLFWTTFIPLVSAQISHSPRAQDLAFARFPRLRKVPGAVIPHGDWRGAYPIGVTRAEARARVGVAADASVIAFVGRVRRYKGIAALLDAFAALDGDATLVVAGDADDDVRADLQRASADPRVKLHLQRAGDDELQDWFAAADLIVYPYRDILNSGSALLALSFGRPVLVPAAGALLDLVAEEGEPWVLTYPLGQLTGDALGRALAIAVTARDLPPPPLAGREWPHIARATLDLYRKIAPGAR